MAVLFGPDRTFILFDKKSHIKPLPHFYIGTYCPCGLKI